MSEKPLKQPMVGIPVDRNGMTLEVVEILQRLNDAVIDLRARVAALEAP